MSCETVVAIGRFQCDRARAPAGRAAASSEIAHERRDAERPRRDLVGAVDAIDERAEERRPDGDDVAYLVRESLAGRAPILRRREHRAEK